MSCLFHGQAICAYTSEKDTTDEEMPEPIFIDQIIAKVAELGRVNQVVNLV